MPAWRITTFEYDVPVERLLRRRLTEEQASFSLRALPSGAEVTVRGKDGQAHLAKAASRMLLRDFQYLVLARMTDAMPLTLGEKRAVLTDALQSARRREEAEPVQAALNEYFSTEDALCADGFLHFRMQDSLMLWQLCVEQAARRVLLQKEYGELMQALHTYVQGQRCRMEVLHIRLNRDGSCILSDGGAFVIEYADASPDGIVRLLADMAPKTLVIHDQSGGTQEQLCEALRQVFSGRVRME